MITELILDSAHPLWALISVTEFLIFLLFVRPLEGRELRPGLRVAAAAVTFALWYGIHLLHAGFVGDFLLNVLLLTLYLYAARVPKLRLSLYVACIFVLCTEIGKIVCVDYCLQPLSDMVWGWSGVTFTLVWAAISQLVALLCVLLVRRWVYQSPLELLSWPQLLFLLLPLVPYIYIRGGSYMYDNSNPTLYRDMVYVSTMLSVSTLVVVVANAHNMAALVRKNELAHMQTLLREQHAQYVALREADEATRRRYHDLKHYASELEAMLGTAQPDPSDRENAAVLASKIKAELEPYDCAIETGNETLDVLLAKKIAACKESGVRPVFCVDAGCLGFVNSFDLCAIFGNLLDNALEAVAQVDGGGEGEGEDGQGAGEGEGEGEGGQGAGEGEGGQGAGEGEGEGGYREIGLDVRRHGGMCSVRVINPYRSDVRPEDVGKHTTKPDAENHGFGLKSVEQILRKYGGSMQIAADGEQFVVTLLIPIPAEEDGDVRGAEGVVTGRNA